MPEGQLDDLLNNPAAIRRLMHDLDRLEREKQHLEQERQLAWQSSIQYKEQSIGLKEHIQGLETENRRLRQSVQEETRKLRGGFDGERKALQEHLRQVTQLLTQREHELKTLQQRSVQATVSREVLDRLEAELSQSKERIRTLTEMRDIEIDQKLKARQPLLEEQLAARFADTAKNLQVELKHAKTRETELTVRLNEAILARALPSEIQSTLPAGGLSTDIDWMVALHQSFQSYLTNRTSTFKHDLEALSKEVDDERRLAKEQQLAMSQQFEAAHAEQEHRQREHMDQAHQARQADHDTHEEEMRALIQRHQESLHGVNTQHQAVLNQQRAAFEHELALLQQQLHTERLTVTQRLDNAKAERERQFHDQMEAARQVLEQVRRDSDDQARAAKLALQEREPELQDARNTIRTLEADRAALTAKTQELSAAHEQFRSLEGELDRVQRERIVAFHNAEQDIARWRQQYHDLQHEKEQLDRTIASLEALAKDKDSQLGHHLNLSNRYDAIEHELLEATKLNTQLNQERTQMLHTFQLSQEESLKKASTIEQLQRLLEDRRSQEHSAAGEWHHKEATWLDEREALLKRLEEAESFRSELNRLIKKKDEEIIELLTRQLSSRDMPAPRRDTLLETSPPPPSESGAQKSTWWQEPAKARGQGGILVSDLVFGIAHQLRNPLGIIRANIQSCLRTLKLKPVEHEQLSMALRNTESMERRIHEFLEFTRPVQFKMQPCQASALLEDAVFFIKERCDKQRITLQLQANPALPPIWGDASRLKQVLLSIMVNALEAMPDGGTLYVAATGDLSRGLVTITIQDNGKGLRADHLTQVMVPFFTMKEGGLGLGLAYAKQILSAHGGTISLSSKELAGTTVHVALPMAPDRASGASGPA